MLHHCRLLSLHANSVEIGGRASAFMGPAGSGKSTLAACLEKAGARVIDDDVSVVRFQGDGSALVSPGLPRLRLWNLFSNPAIACLVLLSTLQSSTGADRLALYILPLQVAVLAVVTKVYTS